MIAQLHRLKCGLLTPFRWLAVLTFLLASQGCGSGSVRYEYSQWPTSGSPCEAGTIGFFVVNTRFQPIPGAQVYALTHHGIDLLGKTDLSGWLCFSPNQLRGAAVIEAIMFCDTGAFCGVIMTSGDDLTQRGENSMIVLAPFAVM